MKKKQEIGTHEPANLLLKLKRILIISNQVRMPEMAKGAGFQRVAMREKFLRGASGGWFRAESSGVPLLSRDPDFRTLMSVTAAPTSGDRLLSQKSHFPPGF